VTANWTPIRQKAQMGSTGASCSRVFVVPEFASAEPRKELCARFFRLPAAKMGEVGQVWEIDHDKIVEILNNFILIVMHLIRTAGAPGPDALRRSSELFRTLLGCRLSNSCGVFCDPGEGTPARLHQCLVFPSLFRRKHDWINQKNGHGNYFRLALANQKP